MGKAIIRFMNQIIELAAFLIVLAGGLLGLGYSLEEDLFLMFFYVPLGVIGGFIVATIILGIPLLALRINQNLEEINATLEGQPISD